MTYHDEPTYRCSLCSDTGIRLRLHPKAGWLGSPCSCPPGQDKRRAWDKTDSAGRVFGDQARRNTVKVREMDRAAAEDSGEPPF